MDFSSVFLIAAFVVSFICLAVALIYILNGRSAPRSLPETKPRIAFFPKYTIPIPSLDSDVPDLAEIMKEKGFTVVESGTGQRTFERGHILGDFSIEWVKVRIRELGKGSNQLMIEYPGPALFDTGDLWKMAKELQRLLSGK